MAEFIEARAESVTIVYSGEEKLLLLGTTVDNRYFAIRGNARALEHLTLKMLRSLPLSNPWETPAPAPSAVPPTTPSDKEQP